VDLGSFLALDVGRVEGWSERLDGTGFGLIILERMEGLKLRREFSFPVVAS